MNAVDSLKYFIPEMFLLAGAFLVLFLDFFVKNKKILFILSLFILSTTAYLAKSHSQFYPLFYGFFGLDFFTHFFRYAALGMVAVTLLVSLAYKPLKQNQGEYVSLFLFMTFGLIMMAASLNLLMIYMAIEFVSILSYILTGFLKHDTRANEAAMKYLLFGSVCSGIMLFGMSYLFGMAGSLELSAIRTKIVQPDFSGIGLTAFFLVMTGLGFKISMAPFHMWAPDVYEGAPTPVTAFLTVGPKALGFAVMIRVLSIAFPDSWSQWNSVITALSILTMTLGNVIAISQTNIKRLLAYSSIAQAGYILMGIAVFSEIGLSGVFVYLTAYIFTNLGAFVVVLIASNHSNT
ncbi:MAG: NADH-quinone oxidoreductase subunit N, partial [Candidatus Omnitrophica bacterium]|nr:NADH-quinone oxidoreductase subunit N [Candidatus Omnitrophota bacterium]